ncbi:NADH:flavin oxidoreductase/NADH oxidase [Silvibacterium sp.]|uniref:NADH:flavin oxidoreductase/NADH oxidase n=1 Tax=Silvibacterium sp. TaxID=1964179 RepID=UPI0039E644DF
MPGLFDSYELKGAKLRNRIVVSPMCQYMAQEGEMTDWHQVHYTSLARGGAGLTIIEATAVSPEGRISWGDTGLWNDQQAEKMEPIVAAMKKWGTVPGIQLAHAGRKASANRPWEGDDHIPEGEKNAWKTIAPSAVPFGANLPRTPEEMSLEEIARVQADTVKAAERARDLGIEWLQMHFAHGYLAQNFFSPISNKRTDQYGGNAENRGRYLLETLKAVRAVWPEDRPLTARFSVVEFDGNDEVMLADAIELLKKFKAEGLDFVDVSVGFNTPNAKIPWGPNFLAETAAKVLTETGLPGTTSWYVASPKDGDALIREGKMDLMTVGRPLLANPHWPYAAAQQLGVEDAAWKTLPASYAHWLSRYR